MKAMSDLIELSDHFRRAVQFENHEAVESLMEAAHRFACECTWIDFTYPVESQVVQKNIRLLTQCLNEIAEAATESGLNRIVLPLPAESPFAQFVTEHILNKQNFDLDLSFRSTDYAKNLQTVGAIDAEIRTILDEGIRGLCAITDDTKHKWDAEIKTIKPA